MMRLGSGVGDQGEALTFGVFEVDHQPLVAFADPRMRDTLRRQSVDPPGERIAPRHAQTRPHHGPRSTLLPANRPVEEGDVAAR